MAILGNLTLMELGLVVLAAIMIFGRNLPKVAAQAFAQFNRARRAMREMWRETGLEEEIRKVERDMRRAKSSLPTSLDPAAIARQATERWIEQDDEEDEARNETSDPDAWRAEELPTETPNEDSSEGTEEKRA